MRKFRVWDELLSEMFYEGFTLTENGMVMKCGWYLRREKERRKRQDEAMAANNGKYCEPKYPQGLIVLQFTGLCDKNGKEIYEGDMVKGWFPCGKEKCVAAITFSKGKFIGWDGYRAIDFNNCEVIGNRFEHAELLENSDV